MCVDKLKKKNVDSIVKLYNDLVIWAMNKFNQTGGLCKTVVVYKYKQDNYPTDKYLHRINNYYHIDLYLEGVNAYWRSLKKYAPANYTIGLSFENKVEKLPFIKNLCSEVSFKTRTYNKNKIIDMHNANYIRFNY